MPALTKLRDIQEWLRWIVTDPRGVEPALQSPNPADRGSRYQAPNTLDAKELIFNSSDTDLIRRLSVYAEGYFSRLHDSLASDFPITTKTLGSEIFLELIHSYLKEFPSRSFNINEAGRYLSEFILANSNQEWPEFLSDLARLEWLLIESFYATDSSGPGLEKLSEIPPQDWAELTLEFASHVHLFSCQWPVHRASGEAQMQRKPSFLLIHRKNGMAKAIDLHPVEFQLMKCLIGEQKLGEALEQSLSMTEPSELEGFELSELQKWFSKWTELKLIQSYRLAQPTQAV